MAKKAGSRMNAVIFFFKNAVGTEIVRFTQEDAITFQPSCKAGFMKLKSLCMKRNITAGEKTKTIAGYGSFLLLHMA